MPGAAHAGVAPEFLLMHHASEEPAPTERFVLSLGAEPEALAAEGSTLVVVMPSASERERVVLSMGTRRNEAIGHWYTEPRGGPRVLRPLDSRGAIVDAEMAGGMAYFLRRISDDNGGSTLELHSIDAEGAGAEWVVVPLPRTLAADGVDDGSLSVGDAKLFRDGIQIGLVWFQAGVLSLARLVEDRWIEETITLTPTVVSPDATLVALTRFGGALVVALCEPAAREPGSPESESPATTVEGEGADRGTIRLLTLRQGVTTEWARFPAPDRSYALASFGPGIALFALDYEGRGLVRSIVPTSSTPDEPIVLMPPGFASARWVHLPILAALSVAFVLTALLFGSDSYLQSRPNVQSHPSPQSHPSLPSRPSPQSPADLPLQSRAGSATTQPPATTPTQRRAGAALSRRFLAFVADSIPGLLIVWVVVGGSPIALVDHPMFRPDIMAALPAAAVLAIGWAVGFLGDMLLGRSPGKRLVGLSIVTRDGRPASLGRRSLRGALSLFSVYSPLVMLVVLVHPWFDGPAEMLSGTSVVDDTPPSAKSDRERS